MADQVARAYKGGGDHAVHQFLRSNPSALRALTTAPEAAVEQRMQAAAGSCDGSNALGAVRDHLEGAVRSNILQSAARRLGGAVHQLQRLGSQMRTSPEVFLRAPADSDKGQQLRALGLDSSATPAEINKAVNESIAGMRELQERIAGQAWEIGDFPASAARAARELGLRSHTGETTVADRVLSEDSGLGQFGVASGLDVAHGVLGIAETVGHGVVAGAPALAFLAIGYHIHHAAEHARGADIVLGRALGL